jgi:hypothetical protein
MDEGSDPILQSDDEKESNFYSDIETVESSIKASAAALRDEPFVLKTVAKLVKNDFCPFSSSNCSVKTPPASSSLSSKHRRQCQSLVLRQETDKFDKEDSARRRRALMELKALSVNQVPSEDGYSSEEAGVSMSASVDTVVSVNAESTTAAPLHVLCFPASNIEGSKSTSSSAEKSDSKSLVSPESMSRLVCGIADKKVDKDLIEIITTKFGEDARKAFTAVYTIRGVDKRSGALIAVAVKSFDPKNVPTTRRAKATTATSSERKIVTMKQCIHEAFIGVYCANKILEMTGIPCFPYTFGRAAIGTGDHKHDSVVMEYINDPVHLKEALLDDTIHCAEFASFLMQVFASLKMAFDCSAFVHNDLHLENVLLRAPANCANSFTSHGGGEGDDGDTNIDVVVIEYPKCSFKDQPFSIVTSFLATIIDFEYASITVRDDDVDATGIRKLERKYRKDGHTYDTPPFNADAGSCDAQCDGKQDFELAKTFLISTSSGEMSSPLVDTTSGHHPSFHSSIQIAPLSSRWTTNFEEKARTYRYTPSTRYRLNKDVYQGMPIRDLFTLVRESVVCLSRNRGYLKESLLSPILSDGKYDFNNVERLAKTAKEAAKKIGNVRDEKILELFEVLARENLSVEERVFRTHEHWIQSIMENEETKNIASTEPNAFAFVKTRIKTKSDNPEDLCDVTVRASAIDRILDVEYITRMNSENAANSYIEASKLYLTTFYQYLNSPYFSAKNDKSRCEMFFKAFEKKTALVEYALSEIAMIHKWGKVATKAASTLHMFVSMRNTNHGSGDIHNRRHLVPLPIQTKVIYPQQDDDEKNNKQQEAKHHC